jgi:cytochrome P450
MVWARFGPRSVLFLHHPDLVEEVLVAQNRKFIKHYRLRGERRTLGRGLLTSEGEFWRAQRRLAQPAFHRDRIAAYADVMVGFTERMLNSWNDGQTRDVQDDMMRLTLEIVAKTLFDAEIGTDSADASAAMETVMNIFVKRMNRLIPVPDWLPTPSNVRFERAARRLDRIILSIIARRRQRARTGATCSRCCYTPRTKRAEDA